MKIGAFVPQGWRMDLNGIPIEDQWNTIINSAKIIENLNYESIWVYDHFHTVPKPTQDLRLTPSESIKSALPIFVMISMTVPQLISNSL